LKEFFKAEKNGILSFMAMMAKSEQNSLINMTKSFMMMCNQELQIILRCLHQKHDMWQA
jgi:hypothetical protein